MLEDYACDMALNKADNNNKVITYYLMWKLELEYAGESDDSSVILIVTLTTEYIAGP